MMAVLSTVPEGSVEIDAVPVPPAHPLVADVSGLLQVRHDRLGGAFRDSDGVGQVPHPGVGIRDDLDQGPTMRGQQRPRSVVRCLAHTLTITRVIKTARFETRLN